MNGLWQSFSSCGGGAPSKKSTEQGRGAFFSHLPSVISAKKTYELFFFFFLLNAFLRLILISEEKIDSLSDQVR